MRQSNNVGDGVPGLASICEPRYHFPTSMRAAPPVPAKPIRDDNCSPSSRGAAVGATMGTVATRQPMQYGVSVTCDTESRKCQRKHRHRCVHDDVINQVHRVASCRPDQLNQLCLSQGRPRPTTPTIYHNKKHDHCCRWHRSIPSLTRNGTLPPAGMTACRGLMLTSQSLFSEGGKVSEFPSWKDQEVDGWTRINAGKEFVDGRSTCLSIPCLTRSTI